MNYKIHNRDREDWIILIHAFGGNMRIWNKQISLYMEYFNVMTIELRGHGGVEGVNDGKKSYSYKKLSEDIAEIMDFEKIDKAHFGGVSLGTLIISAMAHYHTERVKSLLLAGGITGIPIFSRIIMNLAVRGRRLAPHSFMYKIYSLIVMPKKNHSKARSFFVREVKKMPSYEFFKWLKTILEGHELHDKVDKTVDIPRIFIMGKEDYVFLKYVKKQYTMYKNSRLELMEKCGHVCNIDNPELFNKISIKFLLSV